MEIFKVLRSVCRQFHNFTQFLIFKVFSPSDWASLNSKGSPLKLDIPRDKFATNITLHDNSAGVTYMNLSLPEKDKKLKKITSSSSNTNGNSSNNNKKDAKADIKIQDLERKNVELLEIMDDCNSILGDIIAERESYLVTNAILNGNLANVESAFSDVHNKYERAKIVVQGFQQNELLLKDAISQNERTILDLENRFEVLKDSTAETLEEANETLKKVQRDCDAETNRLKTKIKMMELTINTLENNLKQKTVENDKLSKICDEFIYRK